MEDPRLIMTIMFLIIAFLAPIGLSGWANVPEFLIIVVWVICLIGAIGIWFTPIPN